MAERSHNPYQEPEPRQESTRTTDMRERAGDRRDPAHEWTSEELPHVRDQAHDRGPQRQAGAQEAGCQVRARAAAYDAQGRKAMGQAEKTLTDYIRAKPLQSLVLAASAGLLLGVLWQKASRSGATPDRTGEGE